MHVDQRLRGVANLTTNITHQKGQHAIPEPSETIKAVLEAGVLDRRFIYPSDGSVRRIENWKAPKVGRESMQEIQSYAAKLEAALAPCNRGALLARILTLLSHYRSEPNPPEVEQMIADDWAEDLGGYPLWAVEAACRNWRRSKRFRPQICEMVSLCNEEVEGAMRTLRRVQEIVFHNERTENRLTQDVQSLVEQTARRWTS